MYPGSKTWTATYGMQIAASNMRELLKNTFPREEAGLTQASGGSDGSGDPRELLWHKAQP